MSLGILFEIPGEPPIRLEQLVLDFNGTLACDGVLLPGVAERLRELGKQIQITVLTADTFGTVVQTFRDFAIKIQIVKTDQEKRNFVESLGGGDVIAIGNGGNDIELLKAARLGIAILGPEGMDSRLLPEAKVIFSNINDALDSLLKIRRLTATMRP